MIDRDAVRGGREARGGRSVNGRKVGGTCDVKRKAGENQGQAMVTTSIVRSATDNVHSQQLKAAMKREKRGGEREVERKSQDVDDLDGFDEDDDGENEMRMECGSGYESFLAGNPRSGVYYWLY